MSNTLIRRELETKLTAWGAQNTYVDVVLEGEAYIKADRPFVESFLLPAATLDVSVNGDRQRYVGIFQINVWTKDNIGTGIGDRIVDSLVAYFPVIPKTGRVSVEKTPYASSSILKEGYRMTPVTIKYRYES